MKKMRGVMSKLMAYQIKQGKKYIINNIAIYRVTKIVPIEYNHKIQDIEFMLDSKKNIYFSYNNYRNDKSWVKSIELYKEVRLK
jgi:hypothetical protein